MSLTLVITDAGRAALVNAQHDGTNAVRIASAGVSRTAVVPAKGATVLPGEIKRIATIGGAAVAADVLHLVIRDESTDVYTLRSFALYLADGTLFALYGQADPILEKSAAAMLLLAVDATLVDVSATQISFGSTAFLNPPATTEAQGVVELATDAEARALVDALRALTPRGAAQIFTAANILSRLVTVDGAGSGIDADLVDGRQASEFALLAGATFSRAFGRDPQFFLDINGASPFINFDADDYLVFDRNGDSFSFIVGGEPRARFAPTGTLHLKGYFGGGLEFIDLDETAGIWTNDRGRSVEIGFGGLRQGLRLRIRQSGELEVFNPAGQRTAVLTGNGDLRVAGSVTQGLGLGSV